MYTILYLLNSFNLTLTIFFYKYKKQFLLILYFKKFQEKILNIITAKIYPFNLILKKIIKIRYSIIICN